MTEDPFKPYGVARTADLVRHGLTRQQVARRVESGRWTRLARGWIGDGTASPAVETAVRAGAAVSCVSALRELKVWVPTDGTLHLRYSDHQLRRRKSGSRSCAPKGRPLPITRPVDGLRVALEAAAGCLAPDELTAAVDSALHNGLATSDDVHEWFARYPRSVRAAIARCDPKAESGTESLARLRLRRRRVRVRTQVSITGVGRVDLLLGDRLVLEVDSKEHHTSLSAYRGDRQRDRRLSALGYRPARVTYEDVLYRWDVVEQDLLRMVRRGDHRWPRTRTRRFGPSTG